MQILPPVRLGVHTVAASIAYDRPLWFVGEGPPPAASAIGAKVGDMYLDELSDDIYRLDS
jgi:hypothetical protein